jgi:MraZ protein
MDFLGTFEYQMDDRNRVGLPPRYRDQFDAPAIMTTSRDSCIAVYTQEGFEAAGAEVRARADDSVEGRRYRRFFFSNAYPVPKDGQNRLLIPQKLIEYGGLKKDVVVAGAGDWFEIWDKAKWDAEQAVEGEEE